MARICFRWARSRGWSARFLKKDGFAESGSAAWVHGGEVQNRVIWGCYVDGMWNEDSCPVLQPCLFAFEFRTANFTIAKGSNTPLSVVIESMGHVIPFSYQNQSCSRSFNHAWISILRIFEQQQYFLRYEYLLRWITVFFFFFILSN